jgi:FtsH-binding integral membrane protein
MTELNPELFRNYARRCWLVFAAVVAATLVMVAASYAPISSRGLLIGMVLAVAAFNAALVAGYLMHLVSEKKTIYAMLAFTALFFVALLWLVWWADRDRPALLL